MQRGKTTKNILVIFKKKIFQLNEKEFLSEIGAQGIIRIEDRQYKYLPKGNLVAHFNLEECGHKIGDTYALPRIIKHGYYSKIKNKEELPVLSFKKIIFGKCIAVKEKLKYNDITLEDYKYSFTNIKNDKQLKKQILKRYSQSMPDLSKEGILKLGVSYTLLEII
jgi:hypothetical protein